MSKRQPQELSLSREIVGDLSAADESGLFPARRPGDGCLSRGKSDTPRRFAPWHARARRSVGTEVVTVSLFCPFFFAFITVPLDSDNRFALQDKKMSNRKGGWIYVLDTFSAKSAKTDRVKLNGRLVHHFANFPTDIEELIESRERTSACQTEAGLTRRTKGFQIVQEKRLASWHFLATSIS